MTNKWQPLPTKPPKKFSLRYVDYLFILVVHGTFVSYDCLFKTHVTVAQIHWTVFQTKLKLNLRQCFILYKNRWFWYRILNGNLMRYSLSSWIRFSMLSLLSRLVQGFHIIFLCIFFIETWAFNEIFVLNIKMTEDIYLKSR